MGPVDRNCTPFDAALMTMRIKILLSMLALALLAWCDHLIRQYPFAVEPSEVILIAHAGGGVGSITYSNSLEALDKSYSLGFRYFEIDFSWTESGELVAIHDWQETAERLFPGFMNTPQTSEEFLEFPMRGGLTAIDAARLKEWMESRSDAWLITDIKSRNVEGLKFLKQALGANLARVIPQIYSPVEYEQVKSLGFEHVVFTLYRSQLSPLDISLFALRHELWALTVPKERMAFSPWLKYLRLLGMTVLTHTVNDPDHAVALVRLGAMGFYTDFMLPSDKFSVFEH